MAITLAPNDVRLETAALMAFRLRVSEFTSMNGGGGTPVPDFSAQTIPTLARATTVTSRNARLVSADFPNASVGSSPLDDTAELTTIAALRSAIELENSVENADHDRIREWREQLREYVATVGGAGGDGGTDEGKGQIAAAWSFGDRGRHVEGSEHAWGRDGFEAWSGVGGRNW